MSPEEIKKILNTSQPAMLAKRKAIRLNGNKGHFVFTDLTAQKSETDGYPTKESTQPINVVFLKVRRRLMQGSPNDGIIAFTDEHDNPNDFTTLYVKEGNQKITGIASELREKNDKLKTEQVVYVVFDGEIQKLSVKGLSLRDKDNKGGGGGFYEYISTNQETCRHYTTLTPTQGEKYSYITFTKGKALKEKEQAEVFAMMRQVHDDCERVKAVGAPQVPITQAMIPNTNVPYPQGDDENDETDF